MLRGAVCVVLLLVCYALAMPTSHDTETLSTTESLQKAETPNTAAVVDSLHQPHSMSAVRYYRSLVAANQKDSEFADDVINGKKAVFMVEIFKLPDNGNIEPAARKRRLADASTSADKHESTTAPAVTESLRKFSENVESFSKYPEDKHVSTGQREARGFDSDEHKMLDDDNKEDMSVAETIVFKPLFSYKQDTAARRRSFRDVPINSPEFDYY